MPTKIKGWTSSYQTFKDATVMAAGFWKPITLMVAIWALLGMLFSLILRGFIGGAVGDVSTTAIQVMENGFYVILVLYEFAFFVALIRMVEMKATAPLSEHFTLSYWKKIIPALILSFLITVVLIATTFLLIVPGVILSIWLTFATYIFVLRGENIIESVKGSRELVRGWSWAVLGRLVFLLLVASIISVISVVPETGVMVAGLLTTVFTIVTVFYLGITYKQIVTLKPTRPTRSDITTGQKVGLVLAASLLFGTLALSTAFSDFVAEVYYSDIPNLTDTAQN